MRETTTQMTINEQPQNSVRAISKGLKKVVRWLASQYECLENDKDIRHIQEPNKCKTGIRKSK